MSQGSFLRWALARLVTTVLAFATTSTAIGAAPAASVLEEVVVTASRLRERVLDSPASLSIITERELARSTAPSLAEVLRDIPGVQVTDSGQPGLGRIRIRGEESRRTAVLINSQEVTDHYEVGTPLTLDPAMVERIELIRGSGSVLYGSRALSGVVNFITRKGGTEPVEATLSGSVDGATEGYTSFASVFGNVRGLEYRAAWSKSDHEDRETPAGTMDNTAYESENTYFYTGKAFGSHRVEYTWENYESSSDIYVEEEVRTTPPLNDFYLEAPRRDREKHGLFYQWEVETSWLRELTANAFTQNSKRHFYTYTELRSDTLGYDRDINSFGDLDSDGALVQLDFQPAGGHNLIAGLQYLHDEVDQTRDVDTVYVVPPLPPDTESIRDQAHVETWAWFAQDRWEMNNMLTLTGGLRQYRVEGKLDESNRASLAPGKLDSDDALIGALGLVWAAADDLHLRAHVAQGYVYPSLTQLATGAYAGSSFVNPDPDLDPETSINYELGLRLQRGSLALDAAAFYTESDDYIHHLPCAPEQGCPGSRDRYYTNIGESRAHGVELYAEWNWRAAGLAPYTSLTWMKRRNEFSDFSTWKSGIPSLAGRAGLRWQHAFTGRVTAWSDAYLRGETDSELKEPGTTRSVLEDKDEWGTLNLAVGFDLGERQQYQLVLELFNLTDKEYIPSTENLYGAERSAALKLTLGW